MSCFGNPATLDLGYRFADRRVGSTREAYVWRVEWYMRPIDLTNAVVTFSMTNAVTHEIKLSGGIGAGNADGVASYQPVATDVDTAGIYLCQFVATYGGAVYRSPTLQAMILANPTDPPAAIIPRPTPL
jgi:hypothetical protein